MGCNTSQEQRVLSESNNNSNHDQNNLDNGSDPDNNDIDEFINKKGEITNQQGITTTLPFKFIDDEEIAAIKIQAAFRGHKVRNSVKLSSSSSSVDSKTKKFNQNKCEQKQNSIQKEQTKNDCNLIDLNLQDKELENAATKIQATFRGHMQRKIMTNDKTSTSDLHLKCNNLNEEDIKQITKQVAEELNIDLNDPELNKAATKIQESFRGYKKRKDVTT